MSETQTHFHMGPTGLYEIRVKSGNVDRVWGIERERESPAFGRCVVPTIHLWKKAAVLPKPDNLAGALQHGDECNIIRTAEKGGSNWCFIESRVVFKGRTYLQRGWVSERMLETAGAKHYQEQLT